MSIFDDIRKDAEAGTPGFWSAALERGCHGVIAHSLPEGGANFVALVANDTATPEKEPFRFANARRIARVPQLEAIALAALDPDWIAQRIREIDGDHTKGAGQIGEELAAAFREATE